jgi:hypothetical protein
LSKTSSLLLNARFCAKAQAEVFFQERHIVVGQIAGLCLPGDD